MIEFTPYEIISEYLAYLNIPISKKYYLQRIISHPDYPSLLCVADTLEELGIEHVVARLEERQLPDLVFPYILQFDKRRGTLALIKDQEDLDAYKTDMKYWNGVMIKVAPTITTFNQKKIEDISRTFHGYCLGSEKTGATSIHHMLNRSFHSAHEPFPPPTNYPACS